MGRKRITLKPISNERSRKSTFKQRKEGLITKISQLSMYKKNKFSMGWTK